MAMEGATLMAVAAIQEVCYISIIFTCLCCCMVNPNVFAISSAKPTEFVCSFKQIMTMGGLAA